MVYNKQNNKSTVKTGRRNIKGADAVTPTEAKQSAIDLSHIVQSTELRSISSLVGTENQNRKPESEERPQLTPDWITKEQRQSLVMNHVTSDKDD